MKVLAVLLLLLISGISLGQKTQQNSISYNKEYVITDYIPWTCKNEGYWGSFWWKVTKEKSGIYYYYTVYASSNSYFNVRNRYGLYKKAITKVSDCIIWAKDYEETVSFNVGTVVFDWESTYLFQFYTDDPGPLIKMVYSSVNPYDYSKLK